MQSQIPVIVGILWLVVCTQAPGIITLSQSSTLFAPIGGEYDYTNDQQTGLAAGDIVGGATTNQGFLTAFHDNDTPLNKTDGHMAFRVRLDDHDGTPANPSFERTVWVGIDANIDGSVDAFVGLNRTGSFNEVVIHGSGSGANTTPGSTGVANDAYISYSLNSYPEYMNYRTVNENDYVGFNPLNGDSLDLTDSSTPDYYISFQLPFADVVTFLATKSIDINDQSPLRYMVATATQPNVLNQDIGGVDADYNGDTLWVDLGTFSPTINVGGEELIPEPAAWMMITLALAAGLLRRQRDC